MKAFLAINTNKDKAVQAAQELRKFLAESKITEAAEPEQADVIITLGGDGTILSYAGSDKPILGINLGKLGYMTALELGEIALISRLNDKECFETVERMMLDVTVLRNGVAIYSASALNEAVITRNGLPQLTDMELYFGDKQVASYSADGIIVSTPTGSTAYSMAAGGPITDPRLNAFVITPICSHNPAKSRPLVASADNIIRIVPKGITGKRQMCIALDGRRGIMLSDGDAVIVSKSRNTTKLIKKKGCSFGELLFIND